MVSNLLQVVRYPYESAAILLLWSLYPKSLFNAMYYFIYSTSYPVRWSSVSSAVFGAVSLCYSFKDELNSYLPTFLALTSDSYASRYQSQVYSGLTPRDSFLSTSQSYGATENEGYAEDNADGMGLVGLL